MPTIQTNDVETHYERRGDGPAVVFVHASHVDHAQWTAQLEALADEYTTVAYDVRGHGRTGGSAVADYSVELFADDLDALVEALDLEKPVVCGLSLGGAIAQMYATRHPEKVSGLVLADTFTPGDWRTPERLQWLVLRAMIPLARLVGFERVERVLMVGLHERLRGDEASGEYEKVKRLRAAGPRMSTAEFVKVTRALLRYPGSEVDLSTVSAPALVVYGEHEPGWLKRHAARMAADLPDASVEEIDGAGHVSNLDAPEAFTATLRAYLEEEAFVDATERSEGSEHTATSA